jgi:hypothetical protein
MSKIIAPITESILDRLEEFWESEEYSALIAWNRLDTDDPETEYRRGRLDAVKGMRKLFRRAISEEIFPSDNARAVTPGATEKPLK